MPKKYDNTAISALKNEDRVRKRPGVIFGSDGLEGCQHAFFEILSNAIDEAREGHGNVIRTTVFPDGSIQVEDNGRGCPCDWNEKEGKYNWELVFCELYAGGKYHNNDGANYEYSLGLNGLGACATQYASAWMDATIRRDGNEYKLHFERGVNIGGLSSTPLTTGKKKTSTVITWLPDRDVFTDVDISVAYFEDVLRRQAVVNPGVTFTLDYKGEPSEYRYERGILDYVTEKVTDDKPPAENPNVLSMPVFWEAERRGRDREDKPEYKVKLSAAFCFTNTVNLVEHYHNSSWLEHGGSPEKALKSAFVFALDQYCKQTGKYTKSESKLTYNDIADSLVFISNNFSTQTSYENQTKKAINNKFIQECMTDWLKEQFSVYLIENKQFAEAVANQILVNKRSRETAEKTRLGLKKKLSGSMDITTRVQKFHDCRTRDTDRREIYIVEGDSAMGACIMARDSDFQAVMPVRGKILNCLKAEPSKIFKSEIITDLIKVLGCGVEFTGRFAKDLPPFDLSALRWNKVIICTDADVDGFQIRTLILTMLYRLMPSLMREGFVYIAESPLFELNHKDKTAFAWSDSEKERILEDWGRPKSVQVNRSKGLGENEPEMMWLTTMSPETRRLVKVTPEDEAETKAVFDLLLGDNLAGRKEYIQDYGHEYLDLADIS